MVGTLNLHRTWRHGRNLLAGLGVVAMTLGCVAAEEGPSSIDIVSKTSQIVTDTPIDVAAKSTSLDAELDFTTEGKPTKTIDTPWGPREVYDIRQDPDYKRAVSYCYERGDVTFGDVAIGAINYKYDVWQAPEVKYLRTAHYTSYHDLKRLGCERVSNFPCFNFSQQFFKHQADLKYLGTPELTPEEQELQIFSGTTFRTQSKVGFITDKNLELGRWDASRFLDEPGYLKASGEEKLKVYGTYTKSDKCISFMGKEISRYHFMGSRSHMSFRQTYNSLSNLSCEIWRPEKSYISTNGSERQLK